MREVVVESKGQDFPGPTLICNPERRGRMTYPNKVPPNGTRWNDYTKCRFEEQNGLLGEKMW